MRLVIIATAALAVLSLGLGGCPTVSSDAGDVAIPRPSAQALSLEAQAKLELDEAHWERAAVLYGDLVDASARSAHDRAFALQQLGVCFTELGLLAPALAAFEEVIAGAEAKDAVESVRRVARLTGAPEAELSRALAKLPEARRADVLPALGADDASRVHFLLGSKLRADGQWPEAIAELALVTGADAARAQIAIAISHVALRHSVRASEALRKARELAPMMSDAAEAARLQDRSKLLEGELFYSAAMTVSDDRPKRIVVDRKRLSTALSIWAEIPATSALAPDVAWQRAWATFTLGDYPATVASLDDAAKTGAYLPEAELLRASTQWATKEDKEAKASLEAFIARYAPAVEGLHALQRELDGAPDAPADLVALTLGRQRRVDALKPDTKAPAQHALGDKLLRDAAAWLDEVEQERARVETLAPSIRTSRAVARARDAIDAARSYGAPRFRALAGERLLRESDELGALVRSARNALGTVVSPPKRR